MTAIHNAASKTPGRKGQGCMLEQSTSVPFTGVFFCFPEGNREGEEYGGRTALSFTEEEEEEDRREGVIRGWPVLSLEDASSSGCSARSRRGRHRSNPITNRLVGRTLDSHSFSYRTCPRVPSLEQRTLCRSLFVPEVLCTKDTEEDVEEEEDDDVAGSPNGSVEELETSLPSVVPFDMGAADKKSSPRICFFSPTGTVPSWRSYCAHAKYFPFPHPASAINEKGGSVCKKDAMRGHSLYRDALKWGAMASYTICTCFCSNENELSPLHSPEKGSTFSCVCMVLEELISSTGVSKPFIRSNEIVCCSVLSKFSYQY